MGRKSGLTISESIEYLKGLHLKEKNYRIRTRIMSLILIKESKFKSQIAVSRHLGVDHATVKRWLKQYKEEGLSSLLKLKSGGQRKSVITSIIHQSIERKLNDSENPLLGYWDAVLWIKEQHNLDIKYHALRDYLIRHFKTKLKTPRKSHYKKDAQAIDVFLKTS